MKCKASQKIEDEYCVARLSCELEDKHTGNHLTHYPGLDGEVRIPIYWSGDGSKRIKFYRNNIVS